MKDLGSYRFLQRHNGLRDEIRTLKVSKGSIGQISEGYVLYSNDGEGVRISKTLPFAE